MGEECLTALLNLEINIKPNHKQELIKNSVIRWKGEKERRFLDHEIPDHDEDDSRSKLYRADCINVINIFRYVIKIIISRKL